VGDQVALQFIRPLLFNAEGARIQTSLANIDPITLRRVIEAVCDSLIEADDELTALDQAIGDGDHGTNIKRGTTDGIELSRA
jgi:hypothetical protein